MPHSSPAKNERFSNSHDWWSYVYPEVTHEKLRDLRSFISLEMMRFAVKPLRFDTAGMALSAQEIEQFEILQLTDFKLRQYEGAALGEAGGTLPVTSGDFESALSQPPSRWNEFPEASVRACLGPAASGELRANVLATYHEHLQAGHCPNFDNVVRWVEERKSPPTPILGPLAQAGSSVPVASAQSTSAFHFGLARPQPSDVEGLKALKLDLDDCKPRWNDKRPGAVTLRHSLVTMQDDVARWLRPLLSRNFNNYIDSEGPEREQRRLKPIDGVLKRFASYASRFDGAVVDMRPIVASWYALGSDAASDRAHDKHARPKLPTSQQTPPAGGAGHRSLLASAARVGAHFEDARVAPAQQAAAATARIARRMTVSRANGTFARDFPTFRDVTRLETLLQRLDEFEDRFPSAWENMRLAMKRNVGQWLLYARADNPQPGINDKPACKPKLEACLEQYKTLLEAFGGEGSVEQVEYIKNSLRTDADLHARRAAEPSRAAANSSSAGSQPAAADLRANPHIVYRSAPSESALAQQQPQCPPEISELIEDMNVSAADRTTARFNSFLPAASQAGNWGDCLCASTSLASTSGATDGIREYSLFGPPSTGHKATAGSCGPSLS